MTNHPNRGRKTASVAAPVRAPRRPKLVHDHDADYGALLDAVHASFAHVIDAKATLFTTSAENLWDTFLTNLPAEHDIHTCTACRKFVETFGGLAAIGRDGRHTPIMWPEKVPAFYTASVAAMHKAVVKARVTGPFLIAPQKYWGQPKTGEWTHLAVTPPRGFGFKHLLLTPGQAMAAKREDFGTVARALADFTPAMLAEAMRLLETDSLARSERFIGPVQWLQVLHEKRAAVKDARARDNVLWDAIATAPDGFCHPRSSVIGPLLEDIAAGLPFAEVKAKFDAKMHPLRYQRPQAPPSAGNLAEAEKIVEKLGIALSLERRFARLDECELIWSPAPPQKAAPAGGVFGHLQPKGVTEIRSLDVPALTMTWEKFARVVLPEAEAIELAVPHAYCNFIALTSAGNRGAPPILRWDRDDFPNPVAWYVYHGGTPPSQWGLASGWCKVSGVTMLPTMWGPSPSPHLGEGVVLVLDGAMDSRTNQGNGLFPETLRDELRAVRSTIEAYSERAEMYGRETGSACGMDLRKGAKWPGYVVRVTSRGMQTSYKLDRWD